MNSFQESALSSLLLQDYGVRIIAAIGLALVMYLSGLLIYNTYVHPLSRFPGPWSWTVSRLPFVRAMQKGNLVRHVQEIHTKFGPVVRVAPNELSFIDPDACRDIYAARGHQPSFPKNQVWMGEAIPRASGIVDSNDADHARIRKVWGHAFTDRALKQQELVVLRYVDLFIARLRSLPSGDDLDIVPWFNFLTFDLTGDLAFGESFNCLETGVMHPWISMIFSHFKSATLLASIRFYPRLYRLLMWSLPADVLRKQQEHFKLSKDRVQRRLSLEKGRPDFLQHVLEHSVGDDALTETEIEKTAATMIVAGSETTGTLLSAIISHMIKYPEVLDRLVHEIRSAFHAEEDVRITSVAKLSYLGAVIQETLRVAPPVPTGMPRVVPTGGACISGTWLPGETFVSYANYAAYHSPRNFSSPELFDPIRWLSASHPSQTLDHDALQPFSMGSRNCIGQRLALAETRLIVAKLLWNFNVRSVEGAGVAWGQQKAYTLWEKEGVWIRLEDIRR